MFAAGRAYEQVRNSIGYPHLNVKIGATHAGITVRRGRSNTSVQRGYCFDAYHSGMVVINPCDSVEAKAAVKAAYEHNGPVYLRFGRLAIPVIDDEENYHLSLERNCLKRRNRRYDHSNRSLCQ